MEEHRLKSMGEYDKNIFNQIYSKTRSLTYKLASGIDHSRFGVSPEDIRSWFDIKFLHAFNKYKDKPQEVLLGFIISSLQTYKYRILRKAYAIENSQSIVSMDNDTDGYYPMQIPDTDPVNSNNLYYEGLMDYMSKNLSDNALCLLDLQLNPTPYIIRRQKELGNERIHKIPDRLLLEYFDLGFSEKAFAFIAALKKEIRKATINARDYFLNNPL